MWFILNPFIWGFVAYMVLGFALAPSAVIGVLCGILIFQNAQAGNVKGYGKKNGTYVQPYANIKKPAVRK